MKQIATEAIPSATKNRPASCTASRSTARATLPSAITRSSTSQR